MCPTVRGVKKNMQKVMLFKIPMCALCISKTHTVLPFTQKGVHHTVVYRKAAGVTYPFSGTCAIVDSMPRLMVCPN